MSTSAVSAPAVPPGPDLSTPTIKISDNLDNKKKSLNSITDNSGNEGVDEDEEYHQPHEHNSSEYNVLEKLSERQSAAYRDITFQIPAHFNPVKKNYRKRVSFDTVNLQFEDDNDDDALSENRLYEELAQEDARRRSRFDNLDGYMFELDRGRDRNLSPNPNRASSPMMNSPSPMRMLSPTLSPTRAMAMSPRGSVFGRNSMYPTKPIITQPGCTLTKTHKDFDALYKGKIPGLKPVLPGRVIMVYISGRKHTWVALDWVLRCFAENGDTVVIVGVLGSVLQNLVRNRGLSPARIVAQTPKMRYKLRSHPLYTKVITRNILNYAFQILNPEVIVRVVADMTYGKPKDVLKSMYLLYTPNIVCTGGKIPTAVGAPLRSWTSSKMTDRLVKNFPLPVIVVPAMTMGYFEEQLKKELENREFDEEEEQKNTINRKNTLNRKRSVKKLITDSKGNLLPCIRPESSMHAIDEHSQDDDEDAYSSSSSSEGEEDSVDTKIVMDEDSFDGRKLPRLDEDALSKHLQAKVGSQAEKSDEAKRRRSRRSSASSRSKKGSISNEFSDSESDPVSDSESDSDYSQRSSIASSDSYDSYREICDLYLDYKDDINEVLRQAENKPTDPTTFLAEIKAISDKSAYLCRELKSVNPSFSGKGSKLAREITGSNKFGEVPFKTKSLLEPVEQKPKLKSVNTAPAYSFKEIQRKMKQQQLLDLQSSPPAKESKAPLNMALPHINITGLPSLSPTASATASVRSQSPKTVSGTKNSLKFADSVTSNSRPTKSIYSTTSKLTKAISHEIDTDNKFTIEPSKSHPDLTVLPNFDNSSDKNDKKKKKKMSLKFWK